MRIETDLALIEALTEQSTTLEDFLLKSAQVDDRKPLYLLQSIDGVGEILALTMLDAIHDIDRFGRVPDFLASCRLAPGQHLSAGKKTGAGGSTMGNAHLTWACCQAAARLIRSQDEVKVRLQRQTQQYGTPGAMRRLTQNLARTVYSMIKNQRLFDLDRFLQEEGRHRAAFAPHGTTEKRSQDRHLMRHDERHPAG